MPNLTVVYALACLRELAKFPGDVVEVARIAQRQAIPLAYCQKVLHALALAGVVTSVRGRGFALDRNIAGISMAEVMMALERKNAKEGEDEESSELETALREQFLKHLKSFPVADVLGASAL